MLRHFDEELSVLNQEIIKMGSLVEEAIYQSVESLKQQDKRLAQRVIDADAAVDERELKIDETCLDLIARRQPVAADLRFIDTAMKVSTDLERMADLAVDIAERTMEIADQPLLKPLIDIPKLAVIAQNMTKGSIDAFVQRDVELAKKTLQMENEADKLRNAVQDELVTRAYRAGSLHNKRFPWVRLAVSTYDPSYSLDALTDGVNEEFALVEDETKDNTLYLRPANTPAWDETNANDDHGNKYREDYHIELSDDISNGADIVAGLTYYVDSADCNADAYIIYNTVSYGRGTTFVGVAGVTTWSTSSGTPRVYPPGSYILPGSNGIVMDLHQTRMETYRVGKRGREIQFRLSNAQGRCKLLSLEVEAFAVDRRELKSRI